MYFLQPLIRLFSILCLLVVLYCVPLRASSIIDLGSLGGGYTVAMDINNKGQIVGRSRLGGSAVDHPFVYSAGKMTDLLPGDDRGGSANAIKTRGRLSEVVHLARLCIPVASGSISPPMAVARSG